MKKSWKVMDGPEGLVEELGKVSDGEKHEADVDVIVAVRLIQPWGFNIVDLEYQVRGNPITQSAPLAWRDRAEPVTILVEWARDLFQR